MNRWLVAHRVPTAIGVAVVLPPALAALLHAVGSGVVPVAAALVLVVVVVAVAALGSRWAGLLASVTAAAGFDFFLTRPFFRFTIVDRSEIEVTVLLLLVGIAVTEISARARGHRQTATVDDAYLDAIAATTAAVAAGTDARTVVAKVSDQIASLFAGAQCRFDPTSFGGLPRLQGDGTVEFDGGRWDVQRFGLPTVGVEIRAACKGRPYGRFVVTPPPHTFMPPQAARVVLILAGQAGSALAAVDHAGR